MEYTEKERLALFTLARSQMISLDLVQRILEVSEGPLKALELTPDFYKKSGLFTDEELSRISLILQDKKAPSEFTAMFNKNIHMCFYDDPDYPMKLKFIDMAPPFLFYIGRLPDPHTPALSIIGARECSYYGEESASRIGELAGRYKVQVISGMARGIDSLSQWGCLNGGGASFACLGGGVDICYPRESHALYERLKSEGGIISEHAPGTRCLPPYFAYRNRLISGLSDAVCVIEAKEQSGTLITVDRALEQGRDVYALPGRIYDRTSQGCNRLIKQGAEIIVSPEDFIKDFLLLHHPEFSKGKLNEKKAPLPALSYNEKLIMDILDADAFTPDDLATRLPLASGQILLECINLSAKGLLINMGGCRFRRTYK